MVKEKKVNRATTIYITNVLAQDFGSSFRTKDTQSHIAEFSGSVLAHTRH